MLSSFFVGQRLGVMLAFSTLLDFKLKSVVVHVTAHVVGCDNMLCRDK